MAARIILFMILAALLISGSVFAQSSVNVVIFVDEDSLTVYIPDSGLVSLKGLSFKVDDGSGIKTYSLESYASFRGLPYDSVPAPICFRLVRDTSTRVAPQDCQNITLLLQKLASADVFWYDTSTNISYLLTITQGETLQAICPSGNSRCSVAFTPPSPTPLSPTSSATAVPTATITPEATAKPTLVPEVELAQRGVSSNSDWAPYAPYIRELNNIEVVLVPAGSFMMGSTDEQVAAAVQNCKTALSEQCNPEYFVGESPQTNVAFTDPFWISRYEVTNGQYQICVDAGACTPPGDRLYYDNSAYDDSPVVFVDWFQANDFAIWANMRLPTEAEWEYAARGPGGLIFPWGNDLEENSLNFCDLNCEPDWHDSAVDDGYAQFAPVGTYPGGASWVGALDMSGNVWEWVNSIYTSYPYHSDDGRENGEVADQERVLRGGSWFDPLFISRAMMRGKYSADARESFVGFRVAVSYDAN